MKKKIRRGIIMIGLLNLGSFVLGLIAPILPVVNLMRYKKHDDRNWAALSVMSTSACAISLCFQIFYNDHLVKMEDWTALMDTTDAVASAASTLLIVTILLNAITLIVYRSSEVGCQCNDKIFNDTHYNRDGGDFVNKILKGTLIVFGVILVGIVILVFSFIQSMKPDKEKEEQVKIQAIRRSTCLDSWSSTGCGPEAANLKRIELQGVLQRLHFEATPGHVLALGGSFGMASFPTDGDTYETLLATADRRMYDDKAHRKLPADAGSTEEDPPAGPPRFAKIAVPASCTRNY